MNSRTPPSSRRIAKDSGSGVCGTSPPRMLSSQAIEFRHRQHRGGDSRPRRGRAPAGRACRPRSRRRSGRDAARPGRAARPAGPARPGPPDCRPTAAQARPGALGAGPQPLDLLRRVQPGVVAEDGAVAERGAEPLRRRLLDHMPDLEQRGIDLRGGLQRVAAIDEQRGAVLEHDRHPGRAGEPGQPCEALGAGRHVFALVLVGARHDEAVETARRQFLAQHARPAPGAAAARNPPARDRRASPRRARRAYLPAPRRAPAGSGRRPARARTCRFPAGRRAPRRSARRRRPGRAPIPPPQQLRQAVPVRRQALLPSCNAPVSSASPL